jgi:uncharacterized protein
MADLDELTRVRRKPRQVESDEWIRAFLSRAPACVVGLANEGRIILNPNTFVFDASNDAFYFHTAGEGRTRTAVESSAEITVSIFEMGRLLPAPVVTGFSTEYASVTIFGRVAIVTDRAEIRGVFNMQMKKYFPHLAAGRDYVDFTDEEMLRATVYRVAIDRWTAKENKAALDHEGAAMYPWRHFGGERD